MTRVRSTGSTSESARLNRAESHVASGFLTLSVGLMVLGCTAPDVSFGNCVATCSSDSPCGNAMECKGGLCVARGWQGSCGPGPADAGSGGSTASSTGGTGNVVDTTLHSGGSSGPAITTERGTGGSGSGGVHSTADTSSMLASGGMTTSGGATPAGGIAATGTAENSGGVTPNGGAVASGGQEGGSTGTGGAGGSTGGQATGAAGSATSPSTVGTNADACNDASTPSILTQSLVDGCQGEVYARPLQAAGVDDAEWSAVMPSDLGLTLSKNGIVSGVLGKPGKYDFDVTVKSSSGACTATRRLAISVNGEGTLVCPTIKIKNRPSSALAPASCMAWPYAADFEVSGGTSPFTWQAQSTPPGITFDSTSQHASGNPTDSGDLVLQVTDGTGRSVQRSFAVPQRDKCWFAYVSSESGAQRLHLFDPLLGERLQRPTSNSTDVSVTDYAFSPDGKFIAYRVKDSSDNSSLWLWQAPGWDHEQQLDLGGSVTQYSWSNNGKVLAAAIESGTGTLLGGVSVADVPATQTTAGIQGLYELQPVPVPVDSAITWYGNDAYVAFHAPIYPGYPPTLTEAAYATSGFKVAHSGGPMYDPSLVLYPSSVGFYVMVPETGKLHFYPMNSAVPVFHGNVAIGPGGTYVGLSAEGIVDLYGAADSTDPPEVAAALSAQGCTSILGWASNVARIACVDEETGVVTIHSFDFAHATVASAATTHSESYVGSNWQAHRRLLSPSGTWAALTTGSSLYLANTGSTTPTIVWSVQLRDVQTPPSLSFSPNEQLLAMQDGTMMRVFATESTVNADITDVPNPTKACQDLVLSAPDWCGRFDNVTQPVWSADSGLMGLVRDDTQLVTYDLRDLQNIITIPVTSNCGTTCIDTGRFQPAGDTGQP